VKKISTVAKSGAKSADGRMATEAAWLECEESTGRKEKTEKEKHS
jgi:hypothetical protein